MGHNRMRFFDRVDGHSSLRTRCRPELDAIRTVISEHTHKQKEKKQKGEEKAASSGGSDKRPEPGDGA